jgi:hypothetical protein
MVAAGARGCLTVHDGIVRARKPALLHAVKDLSCHVPAVRAHSPRPVTIARRQKPWIEAMNREDGKQ